MSTKLQQQHIINSLDLQIQLHRAWLGQVTGLKAEKMLRRKKPYAYVLRAGEGENNYYVTFSHPDGSVRHQPFTVTETVEGWYYENHNSGGPYKDGTIDDVLHLIMHCEKEECASLL